VALSLALSGALPGVPSAGSDGPGASSPVVTVVGRTDRERVSIGTPFRYTVEVRAPKDVEVVVPVLGGQLGDFFVTDFGSEPIREEGDLVIVSRWYTMVTYRTGLLFIPGLPVQYRVPGADLERVDGEDVAVRVVSLVDGAADSSDIQDIKGPVAVPFDWTPVLLGVVGCIGLLGLVLVAARLLRRINAPAAAAPPPPPDVVALEALARLRLQQLAGPEERVQWYIALSAIVRAYIEGRFGLRAPEMTTEEFIVAVQRDSRLSPEHRRLLGEFLAECDLVKFARVLPDVGAAERAYEAARRFVSDTRQPSGAGEASRAA
jgi:hypothetical protein